MAEAFESFRNPGGQFNQVVGSPLAGATIAPKALIHHINNTTAISTITPPYTGFGGALYLIADSQFTVTTSGNVALAITTTIATKVYHLVYDPNAALWYPINP